MNIEINFRGEPLSIGVGFGIPPLGDESTFVVRLNECRLLLDDSHASALRYALNKYLGEDFQRHSPPVGISVMPDSPCAICPTCAQVVPPISGATDGFA